MSAAMLAVLGWRRKTKYLRRRSFFPCPCPCLQLNADTIVCGLSAPRDQSASSCAMLVTSSHHIRPHLLHFELNHGFASSSVLMSPRPASKSENNAKVRKPKDGLCVFCQQYKIDDTILGSDFVCGEVKHRSCCCLWRGQTSVMLLAVAK